MKRYETPFDLYNAALGAFLFVSPWLFAYAYQPARVSAFASGALLMLVSLLAIVAFRAWEEWINLAIGCWIVASPWILEFPHRSGMHVAVGVGAVVIYLSLLELWLTRNPGWPDRANAPRAHGEEG
ncbi:MAG: SPW repeat protein [Xanthobacteraceae bacterium]|nr:SPW repeat protein [Xanthobacteraceae bacterium]